MQIKLKYVVEDVDRHGNVRLYYRKKGQPKVRLPAPIGSPEFLTAYHAAKARISKSIENPGLPKIVPKSFRWLCIQYYQSPEYKRLAPRTQRSGDSVDYIMRLHSSQKLKLSAQLSELTKMLSREVLVYHAIKFDKLGTKLSWSALAISQCKLQKHIK